MFHYFCSLRRIRKRGGAAGRPGQRSCVWRRCNMSFRLLPPLPPLPRLGFPSPSLGSGRRGDETTRPRRRGERGLVMPLSPSRTPSPSLYSLSPLFASHASRCLAWAAGGGEARTLDQKDGKKTPCYIFEPLSPLFHFLSPLLALMLPAD